MIQIINISYRNAKLLLLYIIISRYNYYVYYTLDGKHEFVVSDYTNIVGLT